MPRARKKLLLTKAWLNVLVCVGLTLFSLQWAVGASYHPNAPLSPYAAPAAVIGAAALIASLLIAILVSILSHKVGGVLFERTLVVFYAALLSAATVAVLVIEPVPDHFVRFAGYDGYRVPSAYTTVRSNAPGDDAAVRVDYCAEDMTGVYEHWFSRCRQRRSATLGKHPITGSFDAYHFLDDTLEVQRSGDRLTALEDVPLRRLDGDGWIGFTSAGPNDHHRVNFIVDRDGDLLLFSMCRNERRCRLTTKTPEGTLSLTHELGATFQPEAWREEQERVLDLLRPWRVEDAPAGENERS